MKFNTETDVGELDSDSDSDSDMSIQRRALERRYRFDLGFIRQESL